MPTEEHLDPAGRGRNDAAPHGATTEHENSLGAGPGGGADNNKEQTPVRLRGPQQMVHLASDHDRKRGRGPHQAPGQPGAPDHVDQSEERPVPNRGVARSSRAMVTEAPTSSEGPSYSAGEGWRGASPFPLLTSGA